MAVTDGTSPIILAANADSVVRQLCDVTIRVVNGANAGDVVLIHPVSAVELWRHNALGANEVSESHSIPVLHNGIKVSSMPTGCKLFVYYG